MSDSIKDALRALAELGNSIALELVLAEPEKDNGLLPLNNLLGQMEEINGSTPVPAAIQRGLAGARQIVDAIFESAGLFDQDSLAKLGAWAQWLQNATDNAMSGAEIPPWNCSAPQSEPTPSQSPKKVAAV